MSVPLAQLPGDLSTRGSPLTTVVSVFHTVVTSLYNHTLKKSTFPGQNSVGKNNKTHRLISRFSCRLSCVKSPLRAQLVLSPLECTSPPGRRYPGCSCVSVHLTSGRAGPVSQSAGRVCLSPHATPGSRRSTLHERRGLHTHFARTYRFAHTSRFAHTHAHPTHTPCLHPRVRRPQSGRGGAARSQLAARAPRDPRPRDPRGPSPRRCPLCGRGKRVCQRERPGGSPRPPNLGP